MGKNLDITKSLLNENNPEAQTYNIPRYNEQMSTRDKDKCETDQQKSKSFSSITMGRHS